MSGLNEALKDTERNLPIEFATARDIWKAMGLWSAVTTRNALNELHRLGKLERTAEPIPTGFRYKYRRLP